MLSKGSIKGSFLKKGHLSLDL